MLDLPKNTEIRKSISKKVVYARFPFELKGDRKSQFDIDISRMVLIHEISQASVNIIEGKEIKSIFILQIELKQKDYNEKNVMLLSKLFGQNIVMLLKYNDEFQFAVYQTRILHSEWKSEDDMKLSLQGLDLDKVWENFVSQISGIVADNDTSLDEQIVIEEERQKLQKQIEDLEIKSRKETQSKKKFEMFQRIKEYQKRLEDM